MGRPRGIGAWNGIGGHLAFWQRQHAAAHLRLGDVAAWWHAVGQPDIATNGGTASDGNAAQYRRAGIDDDVIFHYWMACIAFDKHTTFIRRKALCAQGNSLIKPYVIANDGGLTYHYTGAMIHEETVANRGARMNVNAST